MSDVVTLETVAELRRLWGEWERHRATGDGSIAEALAASALADRLIYSGSLPTLLDLAQQRLESLRPTAAELAAIRGRYDNRSGAAGTGAAAPPPWVDPDYPPAEFTGFPVVISEVRGSAPPSMDADAPTVIGGP